MTFRSLFVGIDKYRSAVVSDLSCSARDAIALHALFADTFGDAQSLLLTDEKATRTTILEELAKLAEAAVDDVVVIGFSGHGSDTHHLIPADADPDDLDGTAIKLDELTELFARIPATNVLLLLDCCFSGGAGAKVFHAPVASKSLLSADAILAKVSGRGRLIFTASLADQEALEDRRRRHGLFTFFVLEALRGAPEVVAAGQIPVLALVQFVTRSVTAAAEVFREVQQPALKGEIEGSLSFPVLVAGKLYRQCFPEQHPRAVGPDISDLRQFGFPEGVLDTWRTDIPSLNQLQQDAINTTGVLDKQHLVVSAPTSSGKTMIGELAALHGFLSGERAYMLFPLRALVNDKYDEFTQKYGDYGLRVIRSTGEIADDNAALLRGKFDLALLTYERFTAIAVTQPYVLKQVGVIVVDELQMLTDRGRGADLEFLLTYLRARRTSGVEPQLITLSAVVGDTNGFEGWLNARLLRSDQRPVPLDEGLIDLSGRYRFISSDGTEQVVANYVRPEYRKGSAQDVIIPLVRDLVNRGEKIIVFRSTKSIVRSTAEYLAGGLGLPPATETLASFPTGDASVANDQLRRCLQHGVAFHNAELDRAEREAIETTFRDPNSSLKVLVATTTLAMGVNTPAWSVVIEGLNHPDGPYSVAEYKNMIGRAGRLGFTPKGKSFLVATTRAEADGMWARYVLGHPEALVSRFADQEPLSLICRVLAAATAARVGGLRQEDVAAFIQSTFASYQGGAAMSAAAVAEALGRLSAAGLVSQGGDLYTLTELGRIAGELGIQVESVVRIARALRGLPAAQLSESVILAGAQLSTELDAMIFPVHKTSTKERDRWRGAMYREGLPGQVQAALQNGDDRTCTLRCKRLAAIRMWLAGMDISRIETELLQHMPADNAAGAVRATADRTRDLIGVVARIGALVSVEGQSGPVEAEELGARLELGIPQSILWLGMKLKRRLDRGDYLALIRSGLETPAALENASDETLRRAIASESKRALLRAPDQRTVSATRATPLAVPPVQG